MILDKAKILSAMDLPTEVVSAPEWGGDVIVKTMTAGERDEWESAVFSGDGKPVKDLRAKLAIATVVDETGLRLFSFDDVALVAGKSAAVLDRIFDVAKRLNGIGSKDVEQLEKNS